MNRVIRHQETLVYYDVPQLFVARDQVNAQYLCLLVESTDDYDRYVCVPISPERLKDFYLGDIDLRTIYEKPESDEIFYADIVDESQEAIQLIPLDIKQIPENWLPDQGFVYMKEGFEEETIINEATAKNRATIHFSLNPPESRYETKIHSLHLAEALIIYQTLVKHAFKKAISKLNIKNRKELDTPDYYNMDVVGFSPGSFTVHLQSTKQADIFGYDHISKALKKIDELTQNIDDLDIALSIIQENKGHFANAYLRLLEVIVKNESSMSYQWAMPELSEPVNRTISTAQATPLYELLNTKQELTVEQLELIGKVIKADSKRGAWSLYSDEDNKIYNGILSEGAEVSLKGIVIEAQKYKFICEEKVEEILGTGKEKTTIYLISYTEI